MVEQETKRLRSERCVRMVDVILQEAGTREKLLVLSRQVQRGFQTGRVFGYEQGEVW